MKNLTFVVLDIIAVAIVSVLSFGIFPITIGFMPAYIFLILALLMQLFPMFISRKIKEFSYKAVLYSISAIYMLLQLFVSVLGYTILCFVVQTIITISITLLLTDIALLIIVTHIGIIGDKSNQKESAKVFFCERVMCELEKIKSQAKATDDISAVDEVIEKAKYISLNSPDKAAEIELRILQEIENIERLVLSSKTREVKNACEKLNSLFSEREMLCKLYK